MSILSILHLARWWASVGYVCYDWCITSDVSIPMFSVNGLKAVYSIRDVHRYYYIYS